MEALVAAVDDPAAAAQEHEGLSYNAARALDGLVRMLGQ